MLAGGITFRLCVALQVGTGCYHWSAPGAVAAMGNNILAVGILAPLVVALFELG